jgi:acetate CoA/acetoacetate CoA-transferase beta subunit
MEPQTIIARRIAKELSPGMLVNLGIGIPTLVANHLPAGMHVFFQSDSVAKVGRVARLGTFFEF